MSVGQPMKTPVLQGKHIRLRPGQPSDKTDRLAVGRDPEFHRMVGGSAARTRTPLSSEDVERWYAQLASEPLHWVIEADGRCIGTVRLHGLDTANRRARYAIGIFAPEYRSRGYGTAATRLVLDYAFRVLRLHRVELRVLESNTRAIATYKRCGFMREGVERDTAWIDGQWHSDVVMSILEDEYAPADPADPALAGGEGRGILSE